MKSMLRAVLHVAAIHFSAEDFTCAFCNYIFEGSDLAKAIRQHTDHGYKGMFSNEAISYNGLRTIRTKSRNLSENLKCQRRNYQWEDKEVTKEVAVEASHDVKNKCS